MSPDHQQEKIHIRIRKPRNSTEPCDDGLGEEHVKGTNPSGEDLMEGQSGLAYFSGSIDVWVLAALTHPFGDFGQDLQTNKV